MATVGFLKFADFLSEIESGGIRGPVRVEMYRRSDPSPKLPVTYHTFYIEAAAETPADTVVFRCRIGRCETIGWDPPTGQKEMEALHNRAERLVCELHAYLVAEGYDVRPGLIAAAEESKTRAPLPEFLKRAVDA